MTTRLGKVVDVPSSEASMIIRVAEAQARAILGAMRDIALDARRLGGVTDADSPHHRGRGDRSCWAFPMALRPVLRRARPVRWPGPWRMTLDQAAQAVRMLAVMSLVGGRIDPGKIALVREYADAVGVHESYVAVLAEAAAGEIAAAAACMIRKNAESFPRLDLTGIDTDPIAPFLPYRDGRDDPALAARYETLGELAAGPSGAPSSSTSSATASPSPVTPTAWPRASPPPTTPPTC